MLADRYLCLNAAGKPVENDDPSRASLLIAPGQDLPDPVAQARGITLVGGRLTYAGDPGAKPAAALPPPPEAPPRANRPLMMVDTIPAPEATPAASPAPRQASTPPTRETGRHR